jgi:hypothetical protein
MTVLKAAAMIYGLEGLNGIWKEVDMKVFCCANTAMKDVTSGRPTAGF